MHDRGVGRLLVAAVSGNAWRVASPAVARYADGIQPDDLALAAEYHGISGYVRGALHSIGGHDELVDAVLPAYHRGLHTHLRALSDLMLVDAALHAAAAPYVVVKGPVLASTVHERADLRSYSDLDVLVAPPHFGRAVAALLAAGCRLAGSAPRVLLDARAGELPLLLPSGGALDLHWHTLNSPSVRSAFSVDPAALVARATRIDIGGVQAPVLDSSDNLVYVAMHMVLSGAHRLVWSKDVDRLVIAADLSWEQIAARAAGARASLVVAFALRHIGAVFGTTPDSREARAIGDRSPWPWLAAVTARVSRPQDAASNRRLVSRVAARSTRYGVPSSMREVLRKTRAAGLPLGARAQERPTEPDRRALSEFTSWVDRQQD